MNSDLLLFSNISPFLFNYLKSFIFITDSSYNILLKNHQASLHFPHITCISEIKSSTLESIINVQTDSIIDILDSNNVSYRMFFQSTKILNNYIFIFYYTNYSNSHQLNSSDQLLTNIIHDIKSPLNGILGMTTLFEDTTLTSEQLQYLNMIKECSLNIISIINDILDSFNLQSGKISLNISPYSINLLLSSLDDFIHGKLLDNHNVSYNYIINNNVPDIIHIDKERLTQILLNMIDNSIKFTHSGKISIYISSVSFTEYQDKCKKYNFNYVSYIDDCNYIRFNICDTGCGISTKDIPNIFNIFYKTSNQNFNNGLGLFICKELISLMNGVLWIDYSEINKGTCFSFILPIRNNSCNKKNNDVKTILLYDLKTDDLDFFKTHLTNLHFNYIICKNDKDLLYYIKTLDICLGFVNPFSFQSINFCVLFPLIGIISSYKLHMYSFLTDFISYPLDFDNLQNKLDLYITHNTPSSIKLSILIAEDVHINQIVLTKLLNKLNYHNITIVNNGKECIEKLKNNTYDIIFIDLKMPVIDGYGVLEYILKHHDNIYTCVITAYATKNDVQKYLNMGFNDVLLKPFEYIKLKQIFNNYNNFKQVNT
jgi:signal transduction histidine kinase/CheY-like chemotaxis protein